MKKSVKISIIIVIAFAVIAGALFVFRNSVATYLVEKAAADYQNRNFTGSARYIGIARFFNPSDPRIPAYLCKMIGVQSGFNDALPYCVAAITPQLKSSDPDLYRDSIFNSGVAYAAKGRYTLLTLKREDDTDYEQAANYYEKYLAEGGQSQKATTLTFLGDIYFFLLNRPDDAKSMLEQLISSSAFGGLPLENQAREYNLLGRTYLFLKDYDKALAVFDKTLLAVKSFPDNSLFTAQVHLNRGRTLVESGRIKEGIADMLAGGPLINRCLIAGVYYLAKQYTKAVNEAISLKANPWCASIIGFSYFNQGEKLKAKPFLQVFKNWGDNYITDYQSGGNDLDYDLPGKSIYFHRSYDLVLSTLGQIQ